MFSGLTLITPPVAEPVTVADAKLHSRISTTAEDSLIAGYIASARSMCESIARRAFMPQTWRYTLEHWPGRGPMQSANGDWQRWNHIDLPLPPLVSIASFTYTDVLGNVFNMAQGYGSQLGNYLLDTTPEPGRVMLPFSGTWPTTVLLPGSPIQIRYLCGYPSYSGVLSVSASGVATWMSGDKFVSGLAGSWIGIGGASLDVVTVTDDQHMQLAASIIPTGVNFAYTANLVPMPIRHAILLLVGHFYENRESVVIGRNAQIAVEVPFTVNNLLAPYGGPKVASV